MGYTIKAAHRQAPFAGEASVGNHDVTSLLEKAVKSSGADAVLSALSEPEKAALRYMWHLHARASQLPPDGDWLTWLVLTGRGWGKTRVMSEWIRGRIESGEARRIALVGRTPADARDVMVEGESGLKDRANQVAYRESAGRDSGGLTQPANSLARWQRNGAHGNGVGIGHAKGWKLAAEAMGIDWMKRDELTQAIPPAYSEFIGTQLLNDRAGHA